VRAGTRTRGSAWGAAAAAAAALALGCVSTKPTRAERLEQGHALYLTYCVSCHGADGSGGPIAPYLAPPPRDLREIAERQGGEFPRIMVEAWIDGREAIAAHGPREMPVWGYSFREEMELDEDTETKVHERITLLVEYLESVQR
jgi:mono/diheme cytochrome c family protein